MAAHSSALAWKIPWTEEPGRPQSIGSLRVGHDWVTSLSLFTFMHWRRKWQPTPVFLPRESQGWGSLVGYSPGGCKELDMTERLHFTSLSSPLHSSVRMVSSAYFKSLIFLLATLIPAYALSRLAFLMMCAVYKLNKQGDNIQPWWTPFLVSSCCFLTCIQISQEAGKVIWYSHVFQNFPLFVVIHTIKGFIVVSEAEVNVFLELSCFFYDPAVGNLISGSSAFSKFSFNIWNFMVHILLKPGLEKVEH